MNNIRTHKCNTCNINIKVNTCDKKKDLYYFFCCNCLKNVSVCSKQNCNKLFLLTVNDLASSKTIYLLNNNSKFYLYSDIEKIIVMKYGSLINLKKILKDKKEIKKKRVQKMENDKLKREKDLKNLFALNKLEFKNYGDCYSYVHYGTPKLEEVIHNQLAELKEKSKRQFILANELHDINIPLDERLKSCYEYINNLNTKPLDDIVKCIQSEYYSQNSTQDDDKYYLDTISNYDIYV